MLVNGTGLRDYGGLWRELGSNPNPSPSPSPSPSPNRNASREVSIIPSPSKFRDIGRETKPKVPRAPKSAYLCFEQVKS